MEVNRRNALLNKAQASALGIPGNVRNPRGRAGPSQNPGPRGSPYETPYELHTNTARARYVLDSQALMKRVVIVTRRRLDPDNVVRSGGRLHTAFPSPRRPRRVVWRSGPDPPLVLEPCSRVLLANFRLRMRQRCSSACVMPVNILSVLFFSPDSSSDLRQSVDSCKQDCSSTTVHLKPLLFWAASQARAIKHGRGMGWGSSG